MCHCLTFRHKGMGVARGMALSRTLVPKGGVRLGYRARVGLGFAGEGCMADLQGKCEERLKRPCRGVAVVGGREEGESVDRVCDVDGRECHSRTLSARHAGWDGVRQDLGRKFLRMDVRSIC